MPAIGNGPASSRGQDVRQQAAAKAVKPAPSRPTPEVRAYQPPGIEKGIDAKEKKFQQSNKFGPGPIKPYPHDPDAPVQRPHFRNGGVYRGGWGSRVAPGPPVSPRSRRA